VLAETGYYGYSRALDEQGLMPGLRAGIAHLRRDESRHIAFGVYLLSRLIAEDDSVWGVIQETLETLMESTMGVVAESYGRFHPSPFGVEFGEFSDYAQNQFQKRWNRLERSRGASVSQVIEQTQAVIDSEDG